jgi:dTDP-4-amino-4,6-dideoxygalactose transaminase
MIPQAAPALRIARYRDTVDAAISSVLTSPNYILGSAVAAFESSFAAYVGVAHCIGVNSGTDAIALSLRAVGIKEGDEVITTALTAAATAQAILQCGARPCFVDVDSKTRCIDPKAVEAAITPRTAAIVPVHLFGTPCDMPALVAIAQKHQLALIEDCAQAHGATIGEQRLGSFGHAAAFSFYPTKNLGGIGDGGAVMTNDASIAARVRRLRNYDFGDDRTVSSLGFNSRLDEIQAAILSTLLPYLDEANEERCAIAARYRHLLGSEGLELPASLSGGVYHQFAIGVENRDGLRNHLAQAQIGTNIHYDPPLHQHPLFSKTNPHPLPVTERLSKSLLSLPIQPEVAEAAAERIAQAIREFISK